MVRILEFLPVEAMLCVTPELLQEGEYALCPF